MSSVPAQSFCPGCGTKLPEATEAAPGLPESPSTVREHEATVYRFKSVPVKGSHSYAQDIGTLNAAWVTKNTVDLADIREHEVAIHRGEFEEWRFRRFSRIMLTIAGGTLLLGVVVGIASEDYGFIWLLPLMSMFFAGIPTWLTMSGDASLRERFLTKRMSEEVFAVRGHSAKFYVVPHYEWKQFLTRLETRLPDETCKHPAGEHAPSSHSVTREEHGSPEHTEPQSETYQSALHSFPADSHYTVSAHGRYNELDENADVLQPQSGGRTVPIVRPRQPASTEATPPDSLVPFECPWCGAQFLAKAVPMSLVFRCTACKKQVLAQVTARGLQ